MWLIVMSIFNMSEEEKNSIRKQHYEATMEHYQDKKTKKDGLKPPEKKSKGKDEIKK